jgi:4-aminobutyrate aminotransferase/(S)-3-amino-2-methylpropionate transaminase
MTLTAKNMPYKQGFGPYAPEVYRVPLAYPFRWPTGPENCAEEASAQAIDMITKQIGAENVFIEPAKGFLPRIAEFCRAHGIVFVADEVQTGFARTGDLFACEDEGVVPDLICTAKGIAGGLPLAAVTGRAELMDRVHAGGLGGTYGGNPLACEAALGVLETLAEQDLVTKARRIGEIMLPRLHALRERFDVIGDVRGRGAMIAIELVVPGSKEPNPAAVQEIVKRCHAEGLLVLTAGTYGNVLRFLPPLVIGEPLLEEGLGILEKAIASL